MNCDDPTPRVGYEQLKHYIGRRVLFVGRVEGMENGLVSLTAPDGSKVSVQAASPFDTPYVEVEGVVQDPCTIREESHVNFGDTFGAARARLFWRARAALPLAAAAAVVALPFSLLLRLCDTCVAVRRCAFACVAAYNNTHNTNAATNATTTSTNNKTNNKQKRHERLQRAAQAHAQPPQQALLLRR